MQRKKIIYLFLLVSFIFVFSSCHPRHVSDIKPNMTKEEVISLWGKTDLITYKTVNGKTLETWEYHFSNTDSICWVTFSQDRVVATQCRPLRGGTYWSYSQSEQGKPGLLPTGQNLVREGSFAMKLAEALKIGPAKSEAEAESRLVQIGIAPRNGWIADYPVTPDIIGELQNAIGAAADSGKLAMKKDEALIAVQILIDNQWKMSVAPGEEQARRGPPKPGTHPPLITHAFAVERGHYGYIWKIYIEADDPDCKMLRIAAMVDEVGYGHYPTDWIYLKPQYQKHFKGYIQWNTYSTNTSFLPPWTQIILKVSVFDEAGNESNEVVFPFSFEITPNEYAYTLPAPFDQGDLPRLGYVHVDLYYPGEGGPRGVGRIGHW